MCGIAGIVGRGIGEREVEEILPRMISVMRYRGPDEAGLYADDGAALGHARLSIIGLEGGIQPIGNPAGNLWIVYNGETYDYVEHRERLRALGHTFSTGTDTEVVLRLYEEYGSDCLQHMNGQFAFAIWNTDTRELFLARDRQGIRPLYYTQHADRFHFASEMKALFVDPEVPCRLDATGLHQVFTFWTTLAPRTPFENVWSLPPGHWMKVTAAGPSEPVAWWRLPEPGEARFDGSIDEAAEAVRALLHDAVRLRLRADVPVGAYLSGGLDSTAVASLIHRDFDRSLRPFSLRFAHDAFDESEHQDEARRHLGIECHARTVTSDDIVDHLPDTVWHCESPLLRTAPVPLFLLSEIVEKTGLKVVLTGEGADEVFGGYNIFKEAKVRRFWSRQPDSVVRPRLLEQLYPYVFANQKRGSAFLQGFFGVDAEDLADDLFSHGIRWRGGLKNTRLFSSDLLESIGDYDPFDAVRSTFGPSLRGHDGLTKAQILEMRIFMSGYLLAAQGDRVAMAHSLEVRMPYLDHRLVEFAFSLPPRWKIQGLDEKHILKRAVGDLVPPSIRERAKQPYRAPVVEAFHGTSSGASYVSELLAPDALAAYGYFAPERVGHLLTRLEKSEQARTNEGLNMAFLGVLTTQLLHSLFVADFRGRAAPKTAPDLKILGPAGRRDSVS